MKLSLIAISLSGYAAAFAPVQKYTRSCPYVNKIVVKDAEGQVSEEATVTGDADTASVAEINTDAADPTVAVTSDEIKDIETQSAAIENQSTAKISFESALGVQPPLGFFDPLGLLNDADQERFDRLRYVELKHGRIAQLAFLGNIITRAGIHLPGDIDYSGTSFDSIGNGWAAISGPNAIPQAGLIQIIAFIGILELAVMKDVTGEAEFPGDFRNGFIDFGWDTFDEETKLQKRAIELNNGRAAQFGILGLMMHEQLGGSIPIVGDM